MRLFFMLAITSLAMMLIAWPVLAAVTLVRFQITAITSTAITLEWETASEFNNLGFFVTRSSSEGGEYVAISDFIPAEGSAVSGSIYQFVDSNLISGQYYYYKLQAVDLNSNFEYFGPISNVPNPTATQSPTQTVTRTVTRTITGTLVTATVRTTVATLSASATITPTVTETSPFSFPTNTLTETATITSEPSSTQEQLPSETATLTEIPTAIVIKTSTPRISPSLTMVVQAESIQRSGAIRSVLIGFFSVVVVGSLILLALFFLSRARRAGDYD